MHSGPADENGRAVFDAATLGVGPHAFSAVYHGFSNAVAIFPQSTSAPVTVTVTSVSTATSASLSNTSIPAGTVVTITASVSSGSGTPFGGATFFDGTTLLGTAALHADGTATFSTASLAAGTHALSASFNANATFAGSSSTPVSLVVTAPLASAIATFSAVSTSLHPENGSITLSAKVAAAHGSPQSALTVVAALCFLGVPFFSGCGGRETQASQIAVVTVQATSGTGQARSVHAAQLVLMFPGR